MPKKIAVITGASRGVGKAVAIYLASAGYKVILLARHETTLKQCCEEITASGGEASYHVLDVSQPSFIQQCFSEIIQRHQQIDLLFNNAGILKFGTTTLSATEIEEVLRINLHGAIHVANAVTAQMKKQQSGYIINMSSMGGKVASSVFGIYNASKFGFTGFNEALAKEMSLYKVKVTAICPTVIATDMVKQMQIKPEDMLQATDVVNTVQYLLSLSANALPLEIIIQSLPLLEKATRPMHEKYFS